jgi:type III pantothenate kinase
MNLVIDSGNTAIKVGVFEKNDLVDKNAFSSIEQMHAHLKDATIENILISSVKADADQISATLGKAGKTFILNHTLPLPVKNLYSTPTTLGVDRLAGACGAQQLFPAQNCLVIDAGTCVTYDFIDKAGAYHGGGISPGLSMRFQAVHTFTAKLPLVPSKSHVALIGNSTETSIQSGVVNGMIAELEGIIHQYRAKFEDLRVILCGGDARFFENQMKASIFASPELVLIGLNSILNYNVNR